MDGTGDEVMAAEGTDPPAPDAAPTTDPHEPRILETVRRFWGFDRLRPLQAQAIRAGLRHRDSLVVLPTGGGKSLCYQVPPVLAERCDVVVSPLISLMKDQVDGLRACGYPAAALHSQLTPDEHRAALDQLESGALALLLVSPERLLRPDFMARLQRLDTRAFAIDEAHCISHWGHDFRPEYRRLAELKQHFPQASVHAFTATATPRVQEDIARQLDLRDPDLLVGRFDRPNLTYRVVPRVETERQVLEIIGRHAGEAVIVYCISRRETERLAEALRGAEVRAAAYHAGLPAQERRRTQEAFAAETLDVVVATVAFGMGIDRSNVRCVVHAAMPKTVEHYQQETGRAGRDGLEAECVLLYSAADAIQWRQLAERSAGEAGVEGDVLAAQLELLDHMRRLASGLACRHAALTRYFGQDYEADECGACDVCLGETTSMEGSTEIAQKILSCVARLDQRYGVGHVVDVLRGAATEPVKRWGHDQLSTWGLLGGMPRTHLFNLVYQLVDQGLLERTAGDRPVLVLNGEALRVLRGEREVGLVEPKTGRGARRTRAEAASWEGVDRDLFEHLRDLRRAIAADRGVPAYVIFGDATLRGLARVRPTSPSLMATVHGVGERKLADLGPEFLEAIGSYCRDRGVETDMS